MKELMVRDGLEWVEGRLGWGEGGFVGLGGEESGLNWLRGEG